MCTTATFKDYCVGAALINYCLARNLFHCAKDTFFLFHLLMIQDYNEEMKYASFFLFIIAPSYFSTRYG